MVDASDTGRRDHAALARGAGLAGGRPGLCATPWQCEETVTPAGIRVRVASSMRDAEGIRAVLRSAWRVSESEPYFYGAFNDAGAVFRAFVEPATRTGDIRRLDVLCLVAEEDDGRIVGTMSLVFDHVRREVELGRGAVAHDARGRRILQQFIEPTARLLQRVPDYAVISDATFLSRSAGSFAERLDAPAVAIHPSSFTIQKSCVREWFDELACSHGTDVARALLDRSEVTGLGRFATAYHLRMPAGQAVYEPCLGDMQRRFYEHTRQVLDLPPSAGAQRPLARSQKVVERKHTATCMIIDPPADVDPTDRVHAAAGAGFETLVMQVPCDQRHLATSQRLQDAGGILSGVFPDAFGVWYASYTFLTTRAHREQALHGLQVLCRHHTLLGSYVALLQRMTSLPQPASMAV